MGVLIITHYQRILHLVKPDFVHVMFNGRIVKEGGPELVTELEAKGYGWITGGGRGGRVAARPWSRRDRSRSRPRPVRDRTALPIEKVRAAFPALAREVNGKPVAYLDSGASAQRVLASIQAVDRYERRHHSNVHRGSHTLSAEATAAYEGARATVADHLGAADRREIVFVRNATEAINLVAYAWGDANVGAGDRIVLTEMEHHSNIVPWQQLAERAGAEIDWVGVTDDGSLDMDGYARRSSASRSSSPSPTSPTSSGRTTRWPRSPASPTTPARWSSPTAPRRRRSCRSTWPSSASTSTRSPATSSTPRPGSARSGRGSTCCARCRRSWAADR